MSKHHVLLALLIATAVVFAGCDKTVDPVPSSSGNELSESDILSLQDACWPGHQEPTPGPLVDVSFGSSVLRFWPYTGHDFSGDPMDPINLVFVGKADPLDIRAALLSLDGNRSAFGFPDAYPFNVPWKDCIGGDVQNTYGEPDGWSGSAIQLTCGNYEPVRVHLRLFKVGNYTLGGTHFEVMIPGTTDHQVLSWELAEQLVVADLMRSGLLDSATPMVPTGTINDSPFRTIPSVVYNLLPDDLKMLTGGPMGQVTEDVPILTDGSATLLNLANRVKWETGTWDESIVINFEQVIPKPFCASGPYDYVYVTGPVTMTQTVRVSRAGQYSSWFKAAGELHVTPVDPITGLPAGETLTGRVFQMQTSLYGRLLNNASSVKYQALMPFDADGSGWFFERFRVGSRGGNGYQLVVHCEPQSAPTAELVTAAPTVDISQTESVKTIAPIN